MGHLVYEVVIHLYTLHKRLHHMVTVGLTDEVSLFQVH